MYKIFLVKNSRYICGREAFGAGTAGARDALRVMGAAQGMDLVTGERAMAEKHTRLGLDDRQGCHGGRHNVWRVLTSVHGHGFHGFNENLARLAEPMAPPPRVQLAQPRSLACAIARARQWSAPPGGRTQKQGETGGQAAARPGGGAKTRQKKGRGSRERRRDEAVTYSWRRGLDLATSSQPRQVMRFDIRDGWSADESGARQALSSRR